MIHLDHIVDMVRLELEFVEDSPKTISLKRVRRLFCVWMLKGSEFVGTCITTSSKTTRNRVGNMKGTKNSTKFSVLC